MRSTRTPYTHTAITAQEVHATVGPSNIPVTVPQGTRCIKLDGGSQPWVVDDLTFLQDRSSILCWDADHYGIRIDEAYLVDIQPAAPRQARIVAVGGTGSLRLGSEADDGVTALWIRGTPGQNND
jgi:hypothetical protein